MILNAALATLIIVNAALAQTKTPPPPPARNSNGSKPSASRSSTAYDPDKLHPSEVACGRVGARNTAPCECMKHRVKLADAARAKCLIIIDDMARLECGLKANACLVEGLVDQDTIWRSMSTGMTKQCSRSCTKARCECCHS